MSAVSGRRLHLRRLGVVGVLVALLFAVAVTTAAAAPSSPGFGPTIDKLAAYQGQTQCDPTEKPGVAGFRALVRATYSGVSTGGISRPCDVGGRSEHKEGRAWDWMVRADVPTDKAKADDMLTWLLATDEHGNTHAMARRLGVMYVIWDRQWWSAWAPEKGWQPYTGSSPHTDHVHVSFSWDGALERTSWWNDGVPSTGPAPTASPSPSPAPSPSPSPSPTTSPSPSPTPSTSPKPPFGDLEQVTATTARTATGTSPAVRAVGWAIDPDAATFTSVRLDVDGAAAATVVADRNRPDVATANPPYSPNHGFDAVVPVRAGTRSVCATAVNQGTGQDAPLGCRTVTVPALTATPTTAPTTTTTTTAPKTTAPAPTGPQPRPTDDSCPSGTIPSAGFDDTVGTVHGPAVDCAVAWQVAKGTGERTFTPEGSLTRGQIASFLARTIAAAGVALPGRPANAFDDDDGSVHELATNQMAALGVLQGKGPRRYAPDDAVTRAQMAAYLVRAHEYRTGTALPTGADLFTDDDASVHEASIGKAARAGFTAGTSATAFSPGLPTTRGQVASFLTRVLDLLVETGWAPDPAGT